MDVDDREGQNVVRSGTGGRPRREGVTRSVVAATAELVTELGYAGTSVDAIAERAGVAKTTIYRRWATKADLAVEALVEVLGDPVFSEIPGPEGLRESIEWLGGRVSDPVVRALLVGLVAESGHDAELRAKLRGRMRDPFAERLVTEQGAPPDRVDLAFDIVVGGLLHRVAMTGTVTRADASAVAGVATRLVFDGQAG